MPWVGVGFTHVNRHVEGHGKKSRCVFSLLGIPPEFIEFSPSGIYSGSNPRVLQDMEIMEMPFTLCDQNVFFEITSVLVSVLMKNACNLLEAPHRKTKL